MNKLRVYWELVWFERGSGKLVNSIRLDTLSDDEVYDAFDQDRTDPEAFDGVFKVRDRQALVLQRHTEHVLDLGRFIYELSQTAEG